MNDRQRNAKREMEYDEETGTGWMLLNGKWRLFEEWEQTGVTKRYPPWDDDDFWGV